MRCYELIIILAINFIMLMNFMESRGEQGSGSLFLPMVSRASAGGDPNSWELDLLDQRVHF